MSEFLAERLFGPERLRLLRKERSLADSAEWKQHDAQADRLASELRDVDRALYRQTLRLEEHTTQATRWSPWRRGGSRS